MTKQQIKHAAIRLIDFAGAAGGRDLVHTIATSGYTAAIDWVDLLGDTPSSEDRDAIRSECQSVAKLELAGL